MIDMEAYAGSRVQADVTPPTTPFSSHLITTNSHPAIVDPRPATRDPCPATPDRCPANADPFESTTDLPSAISPSFSQNEGSVGLKNIDTLVSMFSLRYTVKQIQTLFNYRGGNFDGCVECLMDIDNIRKLVTYHTRSYRQVKVFVNPEDLRSDVLAYYKHSTKLAGKCLLGIVNNSSVVDTCRVRKQMYTSVYEMLPIPEFISLMDPRTT